MNATNAIPCPFCKQSLNCSGNGFYSCSNQACSFPLGISTAPAEECSECDCAPCACLLDRQEATKSAEAKPAEAQADAETPRDLSEIFEDYDSAMAQYERTETGPKRIDAWTKVIQARIALFDRLRIQPAPPTQAPATGQADAPIWKGRTQTAGGEPINPFQTLKNSVKQFVADAIHFCKTPHKDHYADRMAEWDKYIIEQIDALEVGRFHPLLEAPRGGDESPGVRLSTEPSEASMREWCWEGYQENDADFATKWRDAVFATDKAINTVHDLAHACFIAGWEASGHAPDLSQPRPLPEVT